MPNTKSAKKALRQNVKRRKVNLERKSTLKTTVKAYNKMSQDEARNNLPALYKKIDKAAKVNLIKKNKASRLKSRLTKKLSRV